MVTEFQLFKIQAAQVYLFSCGLWLGIFQTMYIVTLKNAIRKLYLTVIAAQDNPLKNNKKWNFMILIIYSVSIRV